MLSVIKYWPTKSFIHQSSNTDQQRCSYHWIKWPTVNYWKKKSLKFLVFQIFEKFRCKTLALVSLGILVLVLNKTDYHILYKKFVCCNNLYLKMIFGEYSFNSWSWKVVHKTVWHVNMSQLQHYSPQAGNLHPWESSTL